MERYGDKVISDIIKRIDKLLTQDTDAERLKELASADKEGRVVVYDTREEAEEAIRRNKNGN